MIASATYRVKKRFLTLTIAWAFCCTLGYPMLERQQARMFYEHDSRACWGSRQGSPDDCLKVAERESGINDWSLAAFYSRESWRLPLVVLGVPLLFLGAYRGVVALRRTVTTGTPPK